MGPPHRIRPRHSHPAISHFSIPAGWSCPDLLDGPCEALAGTGGKYRVEDGLDAQFRCFSASEEAHFLNVRTIRWHNWDLLRKYGTGRNDVDKARHVALDD